jgi:hypothetical protein
MGVKFVFHIKGGTLTEHESVRPYLDLTERMYQEAWENCIMIKLHNLYSSRDIRVTKSRMMHWAGHVSHMGKIRKALVRELKMEETI